jgi:hypothetical protein
MVNDMENVDGEECICPSCGMRVEDENHNII